MPTNHIDTFRQLEAALASAIEADDVEAVTALDGKLVETWNALLDADADDAGAARRLVGFFLDMLVADDRSTLQGQARERILDLFETGSA